MATTTIQGTDPRIALRVALERTVAGRASIADVAVALNVLTALLDEEDDAPPPDIAHAHSGAIRALAVIANGGEELIISAGEDGTLRSWRVDGTHGPLRVSEAPAGSVTALAVVEDDGEPLVVSCGEALRSWRLDGTPADLKVRLPFDGGEALAVVEDGNGPLIISVTGGALLSWRLDGTPGALQVGPGDLREMRNRRGLG